MAGFRSRQSGACPQPRCDVLHGPGRIAERNGAGLERPSPRSSFNFGIFEGGSSINSIPTEARAKIDLRSESLGRIDEMAALLTLAVDQAVEAENARGSGPRVAARIKEIGSRPSGELAG